jgi:predicted RND superfamily exporter protein
MNLNKLSEYRFKQLARLGLICVTVITVFFVYQMQHLRVDYDFEKFFPRDDPETDFFYSYRDKFESDNDFLLIAIENEAGIYDFDFLERVRKYQIRLNRLRDIRFTKSIVSESEILSYGVISTKRPFINFKDRDLERDKKLLEKNKEMFETFLAKDGKSLCIFLRHEDFLSLERTEGLLAYMKRAAKPFEFDQIRIAGRIIGQSFYIEKMGYEMKLFVALSFVLVVFFLLFTFKSFWGVMLPLIVLLGSMIWIIGFMGWYGEPVSVVMTTLPSIMFVVAMSDVIHLVTRYLDVLRNGRSKFISISQAIKEVGMATFLTSLTTSIGFFTLLFISVQPLQVFGLIAGVGVMIAFVLTFVLLPIIIYFLPNPRRLQESRKDPFWKKRLHNWFIIVLRKRRLILFIGLAFMVLSAVGASQIKVNNYLMDELSEDEPMKQNFNFLDENYGGVRPLEIAVTITDSSAQLWDLGVIKRIEKIENYIEKEYGARVKMSLVKSLKIMNRSMHGGQADYFKLPERSKDLRRMRQGLRMADKGQLYHLMVDSAERLIRISGAMPDWGSAVTFKKNKKFDKFLAVELNDSPISCRLTGTAHLFDKNISYLSTSMVKGLSLSILIVALIMGLLYRSFRMVFISIVPNLLPLLFIGGLMGFIGVELKTSTAIIFTIAFGIAVDDTIHFLGKFKYELMKGRSVIYALKRAYMVTGKAMIITTFVLCAGFMMLMISSFQGTFMMGMLLCITLFVALIADLTLLPVLLFLFVKNK